MPVYRQIGFRDTPFVFTPLAASQLVRFCAGELRVPREVREFCYSDAEFEPPASTFPYMRQAEVALLEPNTSVDIRFGEFFLNQNIVQQVVVERAKQIDVKLGKLARLWKADGLLKQREEVRAEAAGQLLKEYPIREPQDRLVRDVIRDARGYHNLEDDLYKQIGEFRELLPIPTGIVLYTFQYMPDARAVSWPPDFKSNMISVAKRLGMKVYDPSILVEQYGVEVSLREDMRHFKDEFYPIVSEVLMDYMKETIADQRATDQLPELSWAR
jgi:hypothetical protein